MENLISNNSGEKEGLCNRLDESDWTVTSWSDEDSHSFICKVEDLEIIQKALVIAHHHYVSLGNFDDALNITKLLFENQDEAGCFIFSDTIENLKKYLLPQKILTKIPAVRWFKIDEILGNISRVFQL